MGFINFNRYDLSIMQTNHAICNRAIAGVITITTVTLFFLDISYPNTEHMLSSLISPCEFMSQSFGFFATAAMETLCSTPPPESCVGNSILLAPLTWGSHQLLCL